jgi:hypothetical protein
VSALILAAGYSSRMGAFKPLLPLDGVSAIACVAGSLRMAGIRDIVVVTGHRGECLLPELAGLNVRRAHNPDFASGMYSSIVTGLNAVPANADACLVLPVDIPLVRATTLRQLLRFAATSDGDIVFPVFRGERGHPPLIRRALFAEIVSGDGAGGLKGLLARHEAAARELEVFDQGILRDMDTPADYVELYARAPLRAHPSRDECEALLAARHVDEAVRRHSRVVADVATVLARALREAGVDIDVARVEACAMLHDIARDQPHHATAGSAAMLELGFPALATPIACHMDLDFGGGEPDACAIVYLADKRVSQDRVVSLDERFRPAFERFADSPDALRGAQRRFASARAIAAAFETRTGRSLDGVLAGLGPHALTPATQWLADTESVCPQCLERIPARRVAIGDDVYLQKDCPQHGTFQTVVWRGLASYRTWGATARPATPRPRPDRDGERGCPFECGLCPEHRQHSCCVLLDVTRRCNLRCPVCFASAGEDRDGDPSLDEIERQLRQLRQRGGEINLQLSGGEPTVRDDLPEIVALARASGFDFVQLNSNGIRLARDEAYTRRLARAGLDCVFLQFDGLDDAVHRRLRGLDLAATKQAAIERCGEHGLGVVLVPTLVPGVNVDAIGAILDFAARHTPVVRAVHFQPVSYFGRYPQAPRDSDRLTLPELMRAIEAQSHGMIAASDFHPGSAENAYCSFSGSFSVDATHGLHALPPQAAQSCGCGDVPHPAQRARRAVAAQWTAPAPEAETAPCCGGSIGTVSLDAFLAQRRRRLSVSAMAFQDAWTLDLERLRDCYIHVASPDRRIVPFCAYHLTAQDGRSLYREDRADSRAGAGS